MRWIIALFMIQNLANAQSNDGMNLPEFVESIGDTLNQVNRKADCPQCGIATAGVDEKAVPPRARQLACMRSLCGGVEGRLYSELYQIGMDIALRPQSIPELNEIKPLLAEAYSTDIKLSRASLDLLRKFAKEGTKATHPRALALYAISNSKVFEHLEVDEGGNLKESAVRAKLKGRPAHLIEFDIYLAGKFVTAMKTQPDLFNEKISYLRQRLSESEIQSQINEVIKALDHEQSRISAQFGLKREVLFGSAAERKELHRRLRQGAYTQDDLDELSSSWLTVALFSLADDKKFMEMIPKAPIDIAQALGKKRLAMLEGHIRHIDNFLGNTLPMDLDGLLFKELSARMHQCSAAVAMGARYQPSAAQLREFNSREKQFRQDYFSRLKAHTSTQSSGTLSSVGAKWRLSLPESKDEFMARFKRGLEDLIAENKDSLQVMKMDSAEFKQVASILVLAQFNAFDKESKYDENLKEFCKDNTPDMHSDHAIRNKDMLHLSSATVLDLVGGLNNAYHEYSHLVSGLISSNKKISGQTKSWYDKSRACLVKGNGGKKSLEEEDWADMLAANFTDKPDNFLCEGMSMEPEMFSLDNKIAGDDEHSSTLFRLLHIEQVRKGKIPTECTEALKSSRQAFRAQNCIASK